jgi:hypothetical protein
MLTPYSFAGAESPGGMGIPFTGWKSEKNAIFVIPGVG